MEFECEYCMVTVPSKDAMEIHTKGKRHQRTVSLAQHKEKMAALTVFVKGFKDDTSDDDMKSHFSKFGAVENVHMEYKMNGLFAMVEFAEESSAKAAIAEESQELNGQSILVKPRRLQIKPPKRQHQSKSKKMKERKKITRPERAMRKNKRTEQGELSQRFAEVSTVGDQMQTLCEFVQMTEEEATQKKEICDMLEATLVKFFPGCTVHQFGSSVNGFGVKGCDADIYLDLNEDQEAMDTQDQPPVRLPYHRDIPSLKKTKGPLTSDDLQQMSSPDKVKLVSRILVEHSVGCNKIISIASARCPLIKFTHEPTGIRCDLSLNNKLALRNTRLLKMCSHLDSRVSPLVYTVRYWAKMKEIAGNLNSGPRLSNYALTFLVIQYLQTLPAPVLPTVESLADMAGKERVMIDGWDCSYLEAAESLAPSQNTQTMEELLKGFFEYYTSLDFSTVVIQTRTGTLMPLQEMIEQNKTAEDKKQVFKIGPVCIQDPFVLNHNIAANVNDKVKQKIAEEFQIAEMKCQQWDTMRGAEAGEEAEGAEANVEPKEEEDETEAVIERDNMVGNDGAEAAIKTESMEGEDVDGTIKTEPMEGENMQIAKHKMAVSFGLVVLFNNFIPFPLRRKILRLQSMDEELERGTTFTLLLKVGQLPAEAFRNQQIADFRLNWCFKVCQFVQRVLEIILMFETQVLSQTLSDRSQNEAEEVENAGHVPQDMSRRKRRRSDKGKVGAKKSRDEPFATPAASEDSEDVLDSLQVEMPGAQSQPQTLHMELLCSSCLRTWNGRKALRKELQEEGDLDGLELEREISEQIIEDHGFSEKYLVQFHMHITTVVENSKTAVMMKLKPTHVGKEFSSFFPFFKTYVRRLVEHSLYEPW